MSSINICERCEAMGLGKAMGVVSIRTAPDQLADVRDLCPLCVGEYMEWFKNGPIGDRPKRAFKDPYQEPATETHLAISDEAAQIMSDAAAYRALKSASAIES